VGDVDRAYRTRVEEREWSEDRDPLKLLAGLLLDRGLATPADLDRVHEEVASQISRGVEFGLQAPYPTPEEVEQDVYA
jgi:pyruvate dehydrogenase E1 component alpha subunit